MGQIIRSDHCDVISVCVFVCPRSVGRNFDPILTKLGTDPWSLKRKNEFVGSQNPITGSPFSPHFTPNWHLHNAFSMEALKHISNDAGRTIIAVHSSSAAILNIEKMVKLSYAPPQPKNHVMPISVEICMLGLILTLYVTL